MNEQTIGIMIILGAITVGAWAFALIDRWNLKKKGLIE